MSPLAWRKPLPQLILESSTSHYHQLSLISDARSCRVGELNTEELMVNTLLNLEVLPPFHPTPPALHGLHAIP